ncbi:MAG: Fe-S cluster assembly protein HesB, partial [Planctomycetes bacterium]|nr:Fe-S cluster assembly protein HesB [Planctomycetota bacterium]
MGYPLGMALTSTISFQLPDRFGYRETLFGHGWIDLAPHEFDEPTQRFSTVFMMPGGAADVEVSAAGSRRLRAKITTRRALDPKARSFARASLVRMFRIDEDFREFHDRCRRDPDRAWVCDRGAGRLLRSPTLFEDLVKILFTTNCSWSATRGMVTRLVDGWGPVAPSGRRAFPRPQDLAEASPETLKRELRCGYRDRALHRLIAGFAGGSLTEARFSDPALSTDARRRLVLGLDGFGPYAAGQALRLLGDYQDLALD